MTSSSIIDLDARRVYKHPPIIEAIVEFTFGGGEDWNLTIPGRLYERVRDSYPGEPQQREIVEANWGTEGADGVDPPNQGLALTVSKKSERVVFSSDNKLLMVGPAVLSVHSLAPYEGWESLHARATDALEKYCEVARPECISSIGLRYVNRIKLPGPTVAFEEYFTVAQALPATGFPPNLGAFFDRMELYYEEIPARIAFTWASVNSDDPEAAVFLLDLDLRWRDKTPFENADSNLADLRGRERAAFESLITNKLREIFDADQIA
ncbi:TIGR04255 family protein [Micromonospora sp. U21]|uniref:TIGR04255 family protein n=1 Tax=Micromonospora sp. U21 TaxID=2824899 RepID=UPI001B39C955|nr:TIGR04255 family protein [Micromonospora sp. U21]MBQ0905782.1 TIGR04255 family protein [Micromonospora sp. U21]